MIKWIVKRILGKQIRQVNKTILESDTTKNVAAGSITAFVIVRAIIAAFVELGLVPSQLADETAMVIMAVIIPLISRLIALIRSS